MEVKKTERGFQFVQFDDINGCECSIQQSSAIIGETQEAWDHPGTSALWLGSEPNRMHLSRDLARELLVVLRKWCSTGYLDGEVPHGK